MEKEKERRRADQRKEEQNRREKKLRRAAHRNSIAHRVTKRQRDSIATGHRKRKLRGIRNTNGIGNRGGTTKVN